jgi:sulfate adenylyltransferase
VTAEGPDAEKPRDGTSYKGIRPHGGRLINRFGRADTADMFTIDTTTDLAADAENIADGIMSPLEGFMVQQDLESVTSRGRLPDDTAWTIPMLLAVNRETAAAAKDAGDVLLRDPLGNGYAVLHVEESFKLARKDIAQKVFGTTDISHPGVAKTISMEGFAVGGKITYVKRPSMTELRRHRLTPVETRDIFSDLGWKTIVAFQTRNPPHVAHEMLQKTSITVRDGVFVSPILGEKKSGDFTNDVIIKSYELMMLYYYAPNRCKMSTLHTEMKYAGPKEAIHHAIMRQNYGCTHIAIGRDHAGVGSFYEPFAAHKIFGDYPDLEIAPIFFPAFFYCRSCLTFTNAKVCPHGVEDRETISGTKLRELVESNTMPSQYIMRPEVARLILRMPNKFVP